MSRVARGAALVRWLVRYGHRHPYPVLAAAAVVVVAGVVFGTHLAFDTDVMSLVPRHDPVIDEFRRTFERFGSMDTLIVAVRVPSEEELETSLRLVDLLTEELQQSPHLQHVRGQLQDPVRLAEAVLRHAVLFLDEEGLAAFGKQLQRDALFHRAADIRSALEAPHGMLAKELATRDPLGFLPLLLRRVSSTPSSLKIDFSSGYYLAEDHSLALVLAKPVRPPQDIGFDEELFADVTARVERAKALLAEEEELDTAQLPEVLLGGGYRIALEDARLIRSDIITNATMSVVGVMLLFFLAYRRLATAHVAFFPLATGLALTFVFAFFALGRVSSATSGFAALLVGLGIDFTIVMYGRYLEGRLAGLDIGQALDVMATFSGPAVLLGAVTTVGTFFTFFVTRFPGLRELGLLTGTGIVLLAVSAFLLLPALVTLFDRGRAPVPHSAWLDLRGVLGFAERHRRAVLVVWGAVTLASFALAPGLRLDDDVRNLRSPANAGVRIQEEVAQAFGFSFNSMIIRVRGADERELFERARAVTEGLDPLVAKGVLSSYESVVNLVPPLEAQERALEWLRDHADLSEPAAVRATLTAALEANGLVPEAFSAGLDALESTLRPAGPLTLDAWKGTPVEELLERSIRVEASGCETIVTVFPPPGMWRRTAPPELVRLVATVPGAALTGTNVVSERLRQVVWTDAALAGGVGLVVVFLMLLWEFASVGSALFCLIPVASGVAWTVGAMVLLDFPLNLLNIFVLTMVIGVGVDYGIHVLHRLREGGSREGLAETARMVVLAALTTIVGFGSLVTTHYPGLQSIGWMTSSGVLFACLAAIVVLPLLWGSGKKP
ncbi:MAG: MMPL family transporter [Thermoanaerobaculaceae bacterium]|nr:MMPL family transporter [Thermoanaerobaculaceae bacterium]